MKTLTLLPTSISFMEPTKQHQTDDITDAALAKKLEGKYHIVRTFAKSKQKDIRSVVIEEVTRSWRAGISQERTFGVIAEGIKDLYRRFMLDNATGIITKASLRRGNQSFINTGEYYRQMRVRVN